MTLDVLKSVKLKKSKRKVRFYDMVDLVAQCIDIVGGLS